MNCKHGVALALSAAKKLNDGTALPESEEGMSLRLDLTLSPVFQFFFFYAPLRSRRGFGILCAVFRHGEVAQLVEHHVRNVGVESSNLFFSTIRGPQFGCGIISASTQQGECLCS